MDSNNVFADVIFAIVFSILGLYFAFRKSRVIDALMSSNKVLWDKFGVAPNEKMAMFLANVMIPTVGVVFLATAALFIYKFITHFFH